MKVPESGMPEEAYWESLFDIPLILDRFGIDGSVADVAELGCGYGSFTVPVARRISGSVYAFDIEPGMTERTRLRCTEAGISNVRAALRDVMSDGFGLPDARCDAVLLFNILHCPEPGYLLAESARIAAADGRILAIHWRSDIPTPRGPSLEIRPTADRLVALAESVGLVAAGIHDLPPWHFGLTLVKKR